MAAEGKEVSIRKDGDAVILEPLRSDRPRDWSAYWGRLDALIEGELPGRVDERVEQ
jgi:virulence-associated protein VagC